MYTNTYDELPKLRVELNRQRFLVIVVTILVFFVLPVGGISYYQHKENSNEEVITADANFENDSQEGRVAGVSTDSTGIASNSKMSLQEKLGLRGESGKYILLGVFFIVTAFLTLGYMLYDHRKYKKMLLLSKPDDFIDPDAFYKFRE